MIQLLIDAINHRDYKRSTSLLSDHRYAGAIAGEYPTQLMDNNLYNGVEHIKLPTVTHQIVSTNNPKLLEFIIDNCKANIVNANALQCLYNVLLNRKFDEPVKVNSAISNLRILFRNGVPIPQNIIDKLFFHYMFPSTEDDDTRETIKKSLLKIIREIYILVTFEQFLRHIQNNSARHAIRYINSDISSLYQGLGYHDITGKIDPNYDAGIRGSAVLTAAKLGDQSIKMFEALLGAKNKVDLNFRDKQGVNVVYMLAMRGDLKTLEWVLAKLNYHHLFELLTLKVKDQQNQKFTPFQVSTIASHGQSPEGIYHQVTITLRDAINNYTAYVLETIVVNENPDVLTNLVHAGYDFEKKHPSNQNNVLHYAAKSNIHANIRFIWRHLNNTIKVEFLLAKNEDGHTPLQVAEKQHNQHMVLIINQLATQLVQEMRVEMPDLAIVLTRDRYNISSNNTNQTFSQQSTQIVKFSGNSQSDQRYINLFEEDNDQENLDDESRKRLRLTSNRFTPGI